MLTAAAGLLVLFALWTAAIMYIDVQPIGPEGTAVGFAGLNNRFHALTGVNWLLYTVTDWLGLVPIVVCICFGVLGLKQLIQRKSLLKVDADILLLGAYYILVILGYLIFEMIPINYRPILIDGVMEASYPSSTTLLVLSVMPTLWFQTERRTEKPSARRAVIVFVVLFSAFMVIGRLTAGVHWLTDIIGAALLSAGLYLIYRGCVILSDTKRNEEKSFR
jgi:undecaprenyl-diphosphatase